MKLKNLILRVLYLLIAWVKSRYFFATALLVTSLYQFAHIAEDIVTKDKITVYDERIVQFINMLATPSVTKAVTLITNLGGIDILLFLWLILTNVLLFCRRWKDAALLSISTLGGTCLMFALKDLFQRARPVVGAPILREVGYSFPSGHSTVSMCFYGIIIYLIFRSRLPLLLKLFAGFVLTALIGLIGLSRVYLGVHYPSDVLAGFCLGLAWISVCCCAYQMIEHRTKSDTS